MVKLKQYINFHSDLREDMSDEETTRLMFKHFYPDKDISRFSFKEVNKMVNDISVGMVNDSKELTMVFKMDDIEYGFIPDLEGLSFGEVMDLDSYLNDPQNHHRLMAILYRPIVKYKGSKYKIAKYRGTDGWCDNMLEMPIHIYFSAMSFFEVLGMDLQSVIPSYLPNQEIATPTN